MHLLCNSGALTAGTVSVSDDNERGSVLAFHSIIGFAGGAIAGPIIGFILDINGGTNNTSAWIFAFISWGDIICFLNSVSISSNKN